MLLSTHSLHDSKNMIAKDMFAEELIQVFSRKKGNYLGVVRLGEEFNFCDTDEIEMIDPAEVKNKLQLDLF